MMQHGIMEKDLGLILLVFKGARAPARPRCRPEVMVKRDGRGHSYRGDRGEILGPPRDERQRRHLPRMFSLIKNESLGFEGDQIPP
jgi:hypothetical protein